MATNYPGSLDSYSTKAVGNTISESHINDPQDAIEAIEEKVGTGASGTIAQSASTNTALLGYGASTTGFATISLANTFLVTGSLPTTALPVGSAFQIVNTQTGAVNTGTTVMPYDDSIPRNDEGDEYMTLAITPTSATNKLRIDVVFMGTTVNPRTLVVALFQDATANALAAIAETIANSGTNALKFTHYMTAGTASVTTFKVRAGLQSGGETLTFNGEGGNRKLGGVLASSITITEIAT